jgi:predicted SprT family Zn-dependent metalloprotease
VQIDDAAELARRLMDLHGLTDWSIDFDNAKTRAGVCRSHRQQIGLSRPLTRLHTADEVRETILHEIAHALVGAHHRHDAIWRAKALQIGCSGQRCISSTNGAVPADWVGTCPAGHRVTRHRRPQRVQSCGLCSVTFHPDALFEWTFRGHEAAMPPRFVAEVAAIRARRQPAAAAAETGGMRQPGPAAGPAQLTNGTTVMILGVGRYRGVTGRITKRARTRYHVQTADGLITVPFHLVKPL